MPVYVVRGDYFQFNQYNHSGWVAYVEPHNLAWQALNDHLMELDIQGVTVKELIGFQWIKFNGPTPISQLQPRIFRCYRRSPGSSTFIYLLPEVHQGEMPLTEGVVSMALSSFSAHGVSTVSFLQIDHLQAMHDWVDAWLGAHRASSVKHVYVLMDEPPPAVNQVFIHP